MNGMRRLHRDESGQATAWFVCISIILFGIMALAIDLGFFFHARRVAQNAADPGALAGAAYLQGCPLYGNGDPITAAQQYMNANLVGKAYTKADIVETPTIGSYTPPGGNVGFPTVYTLLTRQQNYILGQFLPGLVGKFVNIPAEAEAVCGPIQTGNVCPMQITGDPTKPVVKDGSGNIVSAYGVTVGQVYSMKDSPGHLGALSAPTGDGTSQWTDFVRGGCSGTPLNVSTADPPNASCNSLPPEECVETKPGNWGNPTVTAFEGGSGSNSNGLYKPELTYTSLYGNPNLFPHGHIDCDLALTVDPSDSSTVLTVRKYDLSTGLPTGSNLTPQQTVDAINALTDPNLMPNANSAPCGGVRKDGSTVPALITDAVQGRFMDIVMTNGSCGSRCDLPVLGIMRMYIVCWINQQDASGGTVPNSQSCAPPGSGKWGPNDTTIYGVFADFTAPHTLPSGGLGNNPLSPKHVVLIK